MNLKRPILVGGLGLSASLWLLNGVGHSGHAFGDGSALLGAIALGGGLWAFKRWNPAGKTNQTPAPWVLSSVDRPMVETALSQATALLDTLETELSETELPEKADSIAHLASIAAQRSAIDQVQTNCDRRTLKLALVGNPGVGKSSILQLLQSDWQTQLPAKAAQVTSLLEVQGDQALPPEDTDLVLFVAAADLTGSELQRIQALVKEGFRLQAIFNKQDQLTPLDRQSVLQRVQTRLNGLNIDLRAIAAVPNAIKVRRHQEDGTTEEFFEQPAADLASLSERLSALVTEEAEQLVLTTALRQAKACQTAAQTLRNDHRRSLAMPIVEQMQWLAAGSAFASPLPSVDLLASGAINAQMIIDLGAIYGQRFSLEQAKTAAGTLAELLVKLGLVELSTQALGSLLKGHAATYLAGGVLQGVSAAYLTRVVGLSLIDFFEAQSLLAPEARQYAFGEMGARLQALFLANKQGLGLQSFVQQALAHLPQAQPAALQP